MRHDPQNSQLMTVERCLALSQVGIALMRERDEEHLLQLIARTACELTGAAFAAFSLRPLDEEGQPLVPADGTLFHLAAVTGLTTAQEALLRRMPLGGDGLLAPIFRQGVPVLVADALAHLPTASQLHTSQPSEEREAAQEAARAYAHGQLAADALPSLGVPAGHPVVRSFLGGPLLDRAGEVCGGLLLGHEQPNQFTQADQTVLVGLAGQAAVALENARLYQLTLRQAEELQATFDSNADGLTLVDRQGKVRRENAAARQLRLGVQEGPQAEALLEALLSAPAHMALAGSGGQPRVVQVSTAQVESRDYLVTARPLHPLAPSAGSGSQDASPTLVSQGWASGGAVVVWHDVTDRRLSAAVLLAQGRASYLEAILEAMTDGVFVYDRQGRIMQANAAAYEVLQHIGLLEAAAHPAQERLATLVAANSQGQRLMPQQLPLARILQGEGITPEHALELQLPRRDGTVLFLSVTGGQIRDAHGEIVGAVAISRDISEQKREERERENRLHLLQLILDDLPSCIYLARGPQARLVLANRAAATVFGATWTPGQTLHAFLSEHGIRILRPDGRPLPFEQMGVLRALRQGETVRQQQKVIWHPDHTALPVLVNAVPFDASQLPMPEGAPAAEEGERERAALVVYEDVTALKEAEALKDEFLSIATHELRSPVAVLKGYADLLLRQSIRGKGVPLSAAQQEGLQEIARTATRLNELIRDVLDVSRLHMERRSLPAEPTDLVSLTEQAVRRQQVISPRHHLSLQTPHAYLMVDMDPQHLEQVVTNLLSNAIKYSPHGGPIEVIIEAEYEAQVARLAIRDHGMGIPAQQQARIFGRFARAENARKSEVAGTGLGLYISRELLERYGGHIWFESTEGVGSTFFVTLPLVVSAPSRVDASAVAR